MIRQLRSWFRLVWPPAWMLATAAICWALIELAYFYIRFMYGAGDGAPGLLVQRDAIFVGCCGAFGMFRVLGFHPLFQDGYRRWLGLTPWRVGKPLPLGPIHLQVQDLLLIAAPLALLHDRQLSIAAGPTAFLMTYLAFLCMSLWLLGQWRVAYSIAFGLGLPVLLVGVNCWAALAATAMLYVVAACGLHRSLAAFPWSEAALHWADRIGLRKKTTKTYALGWHFDKLSTRDQGLAFGRHHRLLIGPLVGWYAFIVLFMSADETLAAVAALPYAAVLFLAVIGRLLLYCLEYHPPISLWGRLWTLRLVIPGYDYVFLAPLATLLLGIAAPAILFALGAPAEIYWPISLAGLLLAAMNLGPSLAHWRLTGAYRLAPTMSNQKEYQRI